MDGDILVFILFMLGATISFMHRRTRIRILYYLWLAVLYVENIARKVRDRRGDPRNS